MTFLDAGSYGGLSIQEGTPATARLARAILSISTDSGRFSVLCPLSLGLQPEAIPTAVAMHRYRMAFRRFISWGQRRGLWSTPSRNRDRRLPGPEGTGLKEPSPLAQAIRSVSTDSGRFSVLCPLSLGLQPEAIRAGGSHASLPDGFSKVHQPSAKA